MLGRMELVAAALRARGIEAVLASATAEVLLGDPQSGPTKSSSCLCSIRRDSVLHPSDQEAT